jgi:hypothetical protein
MNCTHDLFKDQPEDGPTIGPKHAAGIIIYYNLIKYEVVYDCIAYILYYILECFIFEIYCPYINASSQ